MIKYSLALIFILFVLNTAGQTKVLIIQDDSVS